MQTHLQLQSTNKYLKVCVWKGGPGRITLSMTNKAAWKKHHLSRNPQGRKWGKSSTAQEKFKPKKICQLISLSSHGELPQKLELLDKLLLHWNNGDEVELATGIDGGKPRPFLHHTSSVTISYIIKRAEQKCAKSSNKLHKRTETAIFAWTYSIEFEMNWRIQCPEKHIQ